MKKLPPGDANIFTDYIIPAVLPLASDPNPTTRATVAKCIARLAETAQLFLELFEDIKNNPQLDLDTDTNIYHMSYDASLKELHDLFQEIILILLTDKSAYVKRSLLPEISGLCLFFGRQRANEALISHLVTYFNDPDWVLRSEFCDAVVGISTFIGPHSFNEFLLPLLVMALTGSKFLHRSSGVCGGKSFKRACHPCRAWFDSTNQTKRISKANGPTSHPSK